MQIIIIAHYYSFFLYTANIVLKECVAICEFCWYVMFRHTEMINNLRGDIPSFFTNNGTIELTPKTRSNLLIYNGWETSISVTSITRLIKILLSGG